MLYTHLYSTLSDTVDLFFYYQYGLDFGVHGNMKHIIPELT